MVMVLVAQSREARNFKKQNNRNVRSGLIERDEICPTNNNKTLVAFREMPSTKHNQQKRSNQVQRCADGVRKRYRPTTQVKVDSARIRLQLPVRSSYTNYQNHTNFSSANRRDVDRRIVQVGDKSNNRRINPKIRKIGRVMNMNDNKALVRHETKMKEFAQKYYWRYSEISRMERETKNKNEESRWREKVSSRRNEESMKREVEAEQREEKSKQREKEIKRREKECLRREEANVEMEKQQRIIGTLLKNQKSQNDKRRKDLDYERDVVWKLKEKMDRRIADLK